MSVENGVSARKHSANVLGPVCECINRLLEGLAFAGEPAGLPLVTPQDFWTWRAEFSHEGQAVGSIHVSGLQTFWWRGPVPADAAVQERLRASVTNGTALQLHESLLVAARRKIAQSDYRGSIVDAVCSVESVVAPAIRAELANRGVSKGKIGSVVGPNGFGLSDLVQVLFPLLHPAWAPREGLIDAFAQANGRRNKVVHEGEDLTDAEAVRHLDACTDLIDSLRECLGDAGG